MTDRELMQQALDALEEYTNVVTSVNDPNSWGTVADGGRPAREAITALRERLAQPEQEPVANIRIWHKNEEQHAELWNWDKGIETLPDGYYDLYTAPPPQRKPLTDEQLEAMAEKYVTNCYFDTLKFARAIEAAHGIKE